MRTKYVLAGLAPAGVIAVVACRWPEWWWAMLPLALLVAWAIVDRLQTRRTVLRIYPILGHFRYWLSALGPELHQYFVEAENEGRPFTKEQRQIVYDRATNESDVQPFGTLRDLAEPGAEVTMHSIHTAPVLDVEPRVTFGPDRAQPYDASRLNISAMSFGSLGPNAIMALNHGAKIGGFAHDTGEGGLSQYHLVAGADVIWEIGTGYFGCRAPDGTFDEERYVANATRPEVKMIELKLSQGAKPGHGGVLPAAKVTPEIAEARGVPAYEDCLSPMSHSAFDTPVGLLRFIDRLRDKSGGKPTGFKLCVGHPEEVFAICKAIRDTGITPDFITVDGSEGGTGAAPFEFSDSVGMTLEDGLVFVANALTGTGLRPRVRLVASGKIISGFDMLRATALGADTCNSARGMMFALGCIQALRCHTNECPTGITTLDPWRQNALSVDDKKQRVANYHRHTVRSFLTLVAAVGLEHPDRLRPEHVYQRSATRRLEPYTTKHDFVEPGDYLDGRVPERFKPAWDRAQPDRFYRA
ncbi:MAG: FMN-binding glutamate synthase family protein [Phycisphaera sp.]|nr:FMN-binding glutamate synthase family protein [Phycisphaera sp.]